MKKIMKLFVYVAAAAMALASCQKNEMDGPVNDGVQFTINAGIAETKTVITDNGNGTYTPSWDGTESLAVLFELPKKETEAKDATKFTNQTGKGTTAKFSATVTNVPDNGTLYAVSPYDAFGRGFEGGIARLDLNHEQKPTATSFDPACDILVAKPYDYAVVDGAVEVDPLYFTRIMSVLKVNLKSDFDGVKNENVESIKFSTGGVNITGYAKISVENPVFTGEWTTKYDYVTATYESEKISVNGENNSVYFVVAPVTIPVEKELTFTIKTTNYSITKTVKEHPEMTFSAGNVSVINLNIKEDECTSLSGGDDADRYYEKVTSAPADWSGKYLLVNETAAKALSAISTTSTKYGVGTDVAISNEKITATDALTACQVEISNATATSGAYVMMFGGKYLTWTSGNSLNVATEETKNTNWSISLSDGNAVIVNSQDSSRKIFWNQQSPRFACYDTTNQSPVQLYVLVGGDEGGESPSEPAPVLSVTSTEVSLEATDVDGEIEYSVENPVDGVSVVASTEAKWISDFAYDVANKVSFKVEKNNSTAREAVITLSYTGAASKTVTVKQAAASQGGGSEGGETTETWTLVTDASTLSVGDKVVIAAAEYNFALSTDQRSNNRNQASITKNSNTITITDDVQVMTLEAGTIASTYAFNTGSGYLYAASSTKNYLKTESSLTANSSWVISIGDNGVATIKAQGTNTRNWLRYNSTNGDPGPIFSCYSSGQSDVSVYRLEGANEGGGETPEPEPDPTPDPKPETPVYSSLAELVADGAPPTTAKKVTVTLTNEEITKIFVTTSGYRNGVFLQVGEQEIEIFSYDVPEDWIVGGTISGTLTDCDWKLYNSTWELCPANWSELTYKAPEGGSTEPEEPAAPVVATVAQFLAAAEDDVVYEITGVITSVDNTEYGNFYLTDSTGEVLIYGLCSPTGEQKYWQTAGVEVGDIITVRTVRTSHQGTPQGKNALYVSDVNFYIDHTEINVTAEQTTAKFDLSVDVGYTIEYPVGVTELSDEHNNDTATATYTVEFPANEDAEIKTYEIKIVADASFILENPIEGVEYVRTVTIKQAAAEQGGGAYSVIKSVADLSAGTYLLGGNNKDKYADGTMYMWSNASSVSGQKLKTSAVTFTNGNFDADVSSYVHVELIATAKSNVYYIKLGAKYLKGAVKVWSLVDTPVEWTFADMGGTKDGMYFYNEANASYVFINSTTDAIRTYGNSTKYKGIYLFKAN